MRAIAKVEIWNSPVPYLFGGLSLLLLLIALALLLLLCTNRKSPSSSSNNDNPIDDDEENGDGDKEPKTIVEECVPKIAVILAGDDKPTCLAVPVNLPPSSIYRCNCGNVTVVST